MIIPIKFYYMALAEYIRLGKVTLEILNTYDETDLQLVKVKTNLKNALSMLEETRKIIASSQFTDVLKDLDLRRDSAWQCVKYFVSSQANRLNDEIRVEAEVLLKLVNDPSMRLYKQGYQEESHNLNKFIQRIDSSDVLTASVQKISAQEQYNELKASQAAFEEKELEKVEEESAKLKSRREEGFAAMRKSFTKLDKFLDVMGEMTDKSEYAEIASKVNELVESINAEVLARSTRRHNSKEEDDDSAEDNQ